MPAIGLHHFNIRVPAASLDMLRDFYRDLLGLEEGFRPPFGSTGYWLYAAGHPILHLSIRREGEPPADGRAGAIDHIAFACTGLAAMCDRLEAMGIEYRVAHVPLAAQRQVFIRDPAGNGVELNFPETEAG